ncbi:MAG: M48 family metallopeptidase [Xanthomonadales bacterium]|nr:M48 family metallopeptidase [Xanthomonadales bacterium]
MNFFEHQDRSRKQTRWLLLIFAVAVLAVIAVVDLVLLVSLGLLDAQEGAPLFSRQSLLANMPVLLGGAIATGALIGLSSLYKTLTLRGGGGQVARGLGGTLVDPDSRDPLRRRLVNVVEEIALASGVPVPEIYVLEQEAGINAFAAGYSPADAAVAVTRGTLEQLDRSELQGVIAHEFSHILNGDMRLNIRLVGVLFGILVLALIGRRIFFHSNYLGRSRNSGGFAVLAMALALVAVGYVGLFFGRVIKSAVSRQREYLADASAVQFTRDPGSISGALKKIAVNGQHSYLMADTEEVGHMLFGPGRAMNLLATHPPLFQRIQRVEPGFREEELKDLARRMARDAERRQARAARDAERRAREAARPPGPFDARTLIEQIGNPDLERILLAAAMASSLPGPATVMARAVESAPVALLYSLLLEDDEGRRLQLKVIADRLGLPVAEAVEQLVASDGVLETVQRLPLLEIALPALHRQPRQTLERMLGTMDAMTRVDGRIDVFEYLLVRLVRQYLWESANPHRVRVAGRQPLGRRKDAVRTVLAIVAWHGAPDQPDVALAAYQAAVAEALGEQPETLPDTTDWIGQLDGALDALDELTAPAKEQMIRALTLAVRHDGEFRAAELELVRAVCSAMHVPIPALADRRSPGQAGA